MYIPESNRMSDNAEILAFIRRFSFGTLITAAGNRPEATHLPFLITAQDDGILLSAHFAKANGHWRNIEGCDVLVIFSGPHAYISPAWYEKELNVPTWNYMSVHCYGRAWPVTDPEKALAIIESTIDNYEPAYRQQWKRLPENYKAGMMNGIVAFELQVTEIQAKKKLSQNKTRSEQENIIKALSASGDGSAGLTAEYMKEMHGSGS